MSPLNTQADDVLRVEQLDQTLLITLNRPDARNAIDRDLAHRIADAVTRLDEDDDLAVGILAGEGKAFCAGMDLKAFARGERPTVEGRGFAGLVRHPPHKPLIAAVDGDALAGGFEIVLACDLVVAARGARFGLPEVRRGLVAAGGGLWRLRERLPHNIALELVLTGAMISAERLADLGLVSRLVEPGEAVEAACEVGRAIAANAPLAVSASKRVFTQSKDWPASEVFDRQSDLVGPVARSADALEGALAFAEKRPPVWTGA